MADAILNREDYALVDRVMRAFHQEYSEAEGVPLSPPHKGAFSESTALTHCICWGAGCRLLAHLLSHPAEFEQLRVRHFDGSGS